MEWPIYYKDSLIVGNPLADTAVVTLWTPKEVVANALDMSSISVVGQLYTKRGINFIIRNILANPRISKLFITGDDLSGSGESFLNNNFLPDKSIDSKALVAFEQNVRLIDNRKIPAENIPKGQKGQFWAKPLLFKSERVSLPPKYPSEFGSITIRASGISQAWAEALKVLLSFGTESKPVIHYDEGGSSTIKELLNLTVVLDSSVPLLLEVSEFMPFTKNDAKHYTANFFKKEKGGDDYSYGERLFDYNGFNQIERVVKKLKAFPQDKGALAVLWKPKEDSFPRYKSAQPKHVPCLTSIQCQIWDKKLNLTAYFRSNDIGSAWPLNAYALAVLQQKISNEVGVGSGLLTTISNMAQLYERDYPMAQKVVKGYGNKVTCVFDPRGNLVISVVGTMIKVSHISPTGEGTLNAWEEDGTKPNAAQFLGDKIIKDMAISQTAHAMDIGRQLARAEEAVRRGLKFTQDRPLPL